MKKKQLLFIFIMFLSVFAINAQNITITDDEFHEAEPSAMLDVYSLSKGLLIPRMTNEQMNTIPDPIESLIIYNTELNAFFFYTGSEWTLLNSNETELWQTDGENVFLEDLDLKVGIGTNSPTSKLEVVGDYSIEPDSALFRVKNKDNQTVFAVYHDGVRIYVGEGEEKGHPKGFAVGGMSNSKEGEEYLRITRDSVRIWLNTDETKGHPKGFAVGGLSGAKEGEEFLHITPENCLIGPSAGNSITGAENNIFIGTESGLSNTVGSQNLFIGTNSGKSNTSSVNNIFLGTNAGMNHNYGDNNLFIGANSGQTHEAGQDNIFIGNSSGRFVVNTNRNLFIGIAAGYQSSGDENIFIGTNAGFSETESNKFILRNLNSGANQITESLMYGDFLEHKLRINANVGIQGEPDATYELYVYGDAFATSGWFSSDKRWKKEVQPINNALLTITKLEGVNYFWKQDEYPEMNFNNTKQSGFLAQDVEKLIPEAVKTDENGYKAVGYNKIIPYLVEAIKEQQKQIDELQNEIKNLKNK